MKLTNNLKLASNLNLVGKFIKAGLIMLIVIVQANSLMGQSRKELQDEVDRLKKTREALELQYWSLKQNSLKERERITDNLVTLDQTLTTVFERRNSLNEELFLVQGNLNDTRERYALKDEEFATFSSLVKDKIENEANVLRSRFPSELERTLLTINQLRAQSEQQSVESTIDAYFDFQEELVGRGEEIEVYRTNILNEETSVSEEVSVLRAGFVQGSYAGNDQTGFLVRTGDITGTSYEWNAALPGGIEPKIAGSVLAAYNQAEKTAEIEVWVDPTQSGNRVRTFLEDASNSLWVRFLEFFRSGGFMMYPLLLVAIGGFFIGGERIIYFRRNRLKQLTHAREVIHLLEANRMNEAKASVAKHGGLVERLFTPFLKDEKVTREEGERLLEEVLAGILPILDKRLPTLAVLGTIAPLLGLLGTVSGMIALFDVITLYGNNNPQVLAGGISVALVTTQTGLSLAVPIILVHHLLSNTKQRILDYLESIGIMILDIYTLRGEEPVPDANRVASNNIAANPSVGFNSNTVDAANTQPNSNPNPNPSSSLNAPSNTSMGFDAGASVVPNSGVGSPTHLDFDVNVHSRSMFEERSSSNSKPDANS